MHEAIKTDRRELSIKYLMADDANLSRADAEALYDASPEARPTIPLSEEAATLYQKLAAMPIGMREPWRVEGERGKPLLYGRRSLLAYGTIGTWDEFRLIAALVNDLAGKVPEAHSDDLAVDRFAGYMKRKLAAKRAEGRSGWDDPKQCTIRQLSEALIGHVDKGDPLDVAIFAMMIHHRNAQIIAHDDGATRCVACDDVIEEGDLVYIEDGEGGFIHAECCGPEPESYVNADGERLKPGEPIPEPFPFSSKLPESGQ